jgi:hypothetical protein
LQSLARIRLLSRSMYRVRQMSLGVRPALRASEVVIVHERLSAAERALFMAMEPRDRRHSMDMVLWLRAHGPTPSASLEAGTLLHDAGKGRLRLIERVLFVLAGVAGSGFRSRLGREGERGLRGALWRLEHHAALGAGRLEGISTERVQWLVAHHTDAAPPGDDELARLMAADEAC